MRNESPRLAWKVALGVIVACVLAVVWNETRTIEGEAFVATQGGFTVKLPLVDVRLFDERTISEHLGGKRNKAKPLEEYIRPLEKTAKEASEKAHEIWEAGGYKFDKGEMDHLEKESAWRRLESKLIYLHSSYFLLAGLPEVSNISYGGYI